MKRIAVSIVIVFLAALPAQAQLFHRPFVQQVIRSPIVNDLVNFGLSQVLPGLPHIPPLPPLPSGNSASIFVDSSVKTSLDASTKNLQDTDDIMQALLTKNKLALNTAASKPADANAAANDDQFLAFIKKGNDALLAKDFDAAKAAYGEALKLKSNDLAAYTLFQEATSKGAMQQLAADVAAVKKTIVAAPTLANVAIVKDDSVVTIAKTNGMKDVTIKLSAAAPVNLLLEASAQGVDDTKLSGIGLIKKGETSGKVTIISNGLPDDLKLVTINISATFTTAATSTTINIVVMK